jgi:ankyrin repeat protein
MSDSIPNNQELRTPLMLAIHDRSTINTIEELLQDPLVKESINEKDIYGWSALNLAAMRGDRDIIQLLLDNGANPLIIFLK